MLVQGQVGNANPILSTTLLQRQSRNTSVPRGRWIRATIVVLHVCGSLAFRLPPLHYCSLNHCRMNVPANTAALTFLPPPLRNLPITITA